MDKWDTLALIIIVAITMFLVTGAVYKYYPLPPPAQWDSTYKGQQRVRP